MCILETYIFPESFLKKNMKFGVLGRVCFAGRFVPGVWTRSHIYQGKTTNETMYTPKVWRKQPTPRKINMEHDHRGFEDHFPF